MDRDKKLTDSILRRHYGFIMTASWKKTDPDHFRGDFNDGTNCELKTGKYLRKFLTNSDFSRAVVGQFLGDL